MDIKHIQTINKHIHVIPQGIFLYNNTFQKWYSETTARLLFTVYQTEISKWIVWFTVHLYIQWNLCNPTLECCDILYNRTHFSGPLLCLIRQVLTSCTIGHISLAPCCVWLDRFWHPVQSDTFLWPLVVSD